MPIATIQEIMECEPLELRLRIHGERDPVLLSLAEGCQIRRGDQALEPGALRPGMSVRLPEGPPRVLETLDVLPG